MHTRHIQECGNTENDEENKLCFYMLSLEKSGLGGLLTGNL